MRILVVMMLSSMLLSPALAKLPPPSDEAKAKAAEAAAKGAWSGKVGAYQLCKAMDRVAAGYRGTSAAASTPASTPASAPAAPIAMPACADPGAYVAAAPAGDKPLEAAGAHSPAAMATSPPSGKATSAEMTGPRK